MMIVYIETSHTSITYTYMTQLTTNTQTRLAWTRRAIFRIYDVPSMLRRARGRPRGRGLRYTERIPATWSPVERWPRPVDGTGCARGGGWRWRCGACALRSPSRAVRGPPRAGSGRSGWRCRCGAPPRAAEVRPRADTRSSEHLQLHATDVTHKIGNGLGQQKE
jgi:hypothetical protein